MSSLKDLATVTQPTVSLLPSSLSIRVDKAVFPLHLSNPNKTHLVKTGTYQTDTVEMSVMKTPVMVLRAHKGKCIIILDVVTHTRCHRIPKLSLVYSFMCMLLCCSPTLSAAPVMSCDWLVEGQQLVTASWDHTAKLWDLESGQVIHSLEGESTAS